MLLSMNMPFPPRRRGRLAFLSLAFLACLAPAHAHAATGLLRDAAALGPIPGATPVAPTTAGSGVVNVVSRLNHRGLVAAGTGIVLGTSGEVLTNNHVIRGARQVRVSLPGRPEHRAVVLGRDPAHDVALLAVRGTWAPTPATLGDSSTLAVGDPVQAVGNAGGVGALSLAGGFVTGLGSSVTASSDNGSHPETLDGMVETNADIQPGDSGGPLINAAGQVIGMDTAASSGLGAYLGASRGYAIPINAAMAIVQRFHSNPPASPVSRGARGPSRPAA
jgi:S1-C subfamily serine protease